MNDLINKLHERAEGLTDENYHSEAAFLFFLAQYLHDNERTLNIRDLVSDIVEYNWE